MSVSPPEIRLKFTVDKIGSGKTPSGGADAYVSEGVMLLRSQNIHFDGLHLDDVVFIDEETDAAMASTRVAPEDVLLNITGASLGRCAMFPKDTGRANVNQHVCIIRRKRDRVFPHFLNYVLQSSLVQSQIFSGENGSSREGLTFEQIANLRIPIPSPDTQLKIANYLDRETGRLDMLVAEKGRVLERVAEKRRGLITSAVTTGLKPKLKKRDSGIPWLGEIPADWETERSKWLFKERDERSVTGEEEMLTVSHITGVTPRSEKDVNMFEAESNEGYKVCQPGDLVINTLWAWMGAMGIARVHGIVSPAYNVYTPNARLLPDYVDALVRIPTFAQEAIRFSKGVWSSRLRLYPEGFFEMWLPVPPVKEQRAIVAHIATETAKLDVLRGAAERTIRLLKERRAALIAAAVTGQVRIPSAA